MFSFPERYGGLNKGTEITNEILEDVAAQSGIDIKADDYNGFLDGELLVNCGHYLPDPVEIPSEDAIKAYSFLKRKLCM